MSYIQDPNDSKKQVAAGITYPNNSFIATMTVAQKDALRKMAPGTMVFCTDADTHGRIFIYNGSAWKKSTAFVAG